ncbi:hypothetical protein CNBJ3130 [Cryptococcus deneoformans B-3501A]|uniref:Expressed protein n=1 Tax=Cryptococcus deneoformans (strain JEC21 / ATCC MYA-565) TaxID=214684 RepID=Q5KAV1_CRYD1|nr:expressed protein [Cryptococcus neoformans var. neoformans JEC21]XP_773037.1 hypothetical protein CNBJ3130 [Cryptococcus neoformans var. neoformans B-3501A]AAW45777.1 expressed protein [Cryptococcus neoformans var. neoformans JEC21]EAL18390.1 hypothetical protein CNBJ3130 [Cryptococcus neoformans var. neoformans B-3501A]
MKCKSREQHQTIINNRRMPNIVIKQDNVTDPLQSIIPIPKHAVPIIEELLPDILKLCDRSTILSIIQVSKYWNTVGSPLIYETVRVDCEKWWIIPRNETKETKKGTWVFRKVFSRERGSTLNPAEEADGGRLINYNRLHIDHHRPVSSYFVYTHHLTIRCHNEGCGSAIFPSPGEILPKLETLNLEIIPGSEDKCAYSKEMGLITGFTRDLSPRTVILSNVLSLGRICHELYHSPTSLRESAVNSVAKLVVSLPSCRPPRYTLKITNSLERLRSSFPQVKEMVFLLKPKVLGERLDEYAELEKTKGDSDQFYRAETADTYSAELSRLFGYWGSPITIVGLENLGDDWYKSLTRNPTAEEVVNASKRRAGAERRMDIKVVTLRDWLKDEWNWKGVFTAQERELWMGE